MTNTMRLICWIFTMATAINAPSALAQSKTYPPLDRYMMSQGEEVALARSAAPPNISNKAAIKVLTKTGYQTLQQGSNGFVCMVMRGGRPPRTRLHRCETSCMTLISEHRSVSIPSLRGRSCRTTSCAAISRCKARHRIKSPLRGCVRQGGIARERECVVRLHVVCRPEPRTWCWPLASAHDGLLAILQKLNTWPQRVWEPDAYCD